MFFNKARAVSWPPLVYSNMFRYIHIIISGVWWRHTIRGGRGWTVIIIIMLLSFRIDLDDGLISTSDNVIITIWYIKMLCALGYFQSRVSVFVSSMRAIFLIGTFLYCWLKNLILWSTRLQLPLLQHHETKNKTTESRYIL